MYLHKQHVSCWQDFRKRKRIFSDFTPPSYISDDILGGHEERVDILESLELCLIDLADDAGIVRRQLHRLVRELGREVRQVRVRFQPGTKGEGGSFKLRGEKKKSLRRCIKTIL